MKPLRSGGCSLLGEREQRGDQQERDDLVDLAAEAAINAALRSLQTIGIVIAHRPETVACDRVEAKLPLRNP